MKKNGIPVVACCLALSATLLTSCAPQKDEKASRETRSAGGRNSVNMVANVSDKQKEEPLAPQKTRDVLREWETSSQEKGEVLPAAPLTTPPVGETTPAPSSNPNNPFGLPPASSKSPAASSSPESNVLNPLEENEDEEEERSNQDAFALPETGDASPSPTSMPDVSEPIEETAPSRAENQTGVPSHEGLFFGMSTEQVLEQYSNLSYRSGRDALGQYVQITGVADFDSQNGEATAEFYFDDDDQLTAVIYHYALGESFDKANIDQQVEEWNRVFGYLGAEIHYDAEEKSIAGESIFQTLQAKGRVLCSWYGEEIESLVNLNNQAGGAGSIDICVQRGGQPLIQLPELQVAATYEASEWAARAVENELAMEYYDAGKYIQIQGEAIRIARDAQGRASIVLAQNAAGMEVRAVFPEWRMEELLSLKVGEVIQIAGFFTGIERKENQSTLVLSNCRLVSSPSDKQAAPEVEKSPVPSAIPTPQGGAENRKLPTP